MKDSKHVILVVDDEPVVLSFVCRVLERSGYTAIGAASGQAGLIAYRTNADIIDIVISDVLCDCGDGTDGPKLIKAIRAINIALNREPVTSLFMSGYVGGHTSASLLELSGYPLIEKPFTAMDLIDIMEKFLANQPSLIKSAV